MEWWSVGVLGGRVVGHHSITPGLHHSVRQRLERIHDAVARGEEDQRAAIHGGQRGRRPGAVEDVRGDVLVVARDEAAGALVEHDQARRVGRADAPVGVVHAGAGVEVEVIAVNEDGAVGGVVRPDAGAGGEVELPDNARFGACWPAGSLRTSDFGLRISRWRPRIEAERPRRGC